MDGNLKHRFAVVVSLLFTFNLELYVIEYTYLKSKVLVDTDSNSEYISWCASDCYVWICLHIYRFIHTCIFNFKFRVNFNMKTKNQYSADSYETNLMISILLFL